MSKKPVSLEAQLAGQLTPDILAVSTGNVIPMTVTKPTNEKATVYLPKAALKRIKQMALDQDKRINDLLQEGIDLMLTRYGQPNLKDFESK
jgi:hypothetical protein